MIILKATQDKFLSVLQAIAGIIQRRHTLPILANVLLREAGEGAFESTKQTIASHVLACRQPLAQGAWRGSSGLLISKSRSNGFFSASKANLRNAP